MTDYGAANFLMLHQPSSSSQPEAQKNTHLQEEKCPNPQAHWKKGNSHKVFILYWGAILQSWSLSVILLHYLLAFLLSANDMIVAQGL